MVNQSLKLCLIFRPTSTSWSCARIICLPSPHRFLNQAVVFPTTATWFWRLQRRPMAGCLHSAPILPVAAGPAMIKGKASSKQSTNLSELPLEPNSIPPTQMMSSSTPVPCVPRLPTNLRMPNPPERRPKKSKIPHPIIHDSSIIGAADNAQEFIPRLFLKPLPRFKPNLQDERQPWKPPCSMIHRRISCTCVCLLKPPHASSQAEVCPLREQPRRLGEHYVLLARALDAAARQAERQRLRLASSPVPGQCAGLEVIPDGPGRAH